MNLTDIDQLTIKKLIKKLKQDGYGYETQNKVKVVLIDIFNKALTNEYIRKNPAKGISVKRDEKRRLKFFQKKNRYYSLIVQKEHFIIICLSWQFLLV